MYKSFHILDIYANEGDTGTIWQQREVDLRLSLGIVSSCNEVFCNWVAWLNIDIIYSLGFNEYPVI